MLYANPVPYFETTNLYRIKDDLDRYLNREKKKALEQADDTLYYDSVVIKGDKNCAIINAEISASIQGRRLTVVNSNLHTINFEGTLIAFVNTTIQKVITKYVAAFFGCPKLGDINAHTVFLYDSNDYRSIDCNHLETTLRNLHNVNVKSKLQFHLLKSDSSIIFENSHVHPSMTLTIPNVTLVNSVCSKIIFKNIKGSVHLQGSSSIVEVENGIIIDERSSLIEQSAKGVKFSMEALRNLEANLKKNIIGQDYAIKCLVDVIRRSLAGYGSMNKPLGVILLAGPTGVGKTELTKVVVS